MTINEIIEKHFNELEKMIVDTETISYNSNTDDDIFQDTLLKLLKKYKGQEDLPEDETLADIKKEISMAGFFKFKKMNSNTVYIEDIADFSTKY